MRQRYGFEEIEFRIKMALKELKRDERYMDFLVDWKDPSVVYIFYLRTKICITHRDTMKECEGKEISQKLIPTWAMHIFLSMT